MRFLNLTFVSIILFSSSVFAIPKNHVSLSTLIQRRYAEIQNNLKKQLYVTRQISGKRLDDVVTAYFYNNRIELIVSETYGEVGKIRHEYYFGKNGELILASNQLFHYQNATNADKNLVKVNENTYYYQKMKLVKVLNGKNVQTNITHFDAKSRSRYMLGKSMLLTKQIKEHNDETIGQYQQNSNFKKLTRSKPAECGAGCD